MSEDIEIGFAATATVRRVIRVRIPENLVDPVTRMKFAVDAAKKQMDADDCDGENKKSTWTMLRLVTDPQMMQPRVVASLASTPEAGALAAVKPAKVTLFPSV